MSISLDPGIAQDGVSAVELHVSCRDLVKLDTFSESDPFVVLNIHNSKTKQFEELGRTETIDNCPNPKFVTTFTVDYFFEENQPLRFVVYDRDSESHKLEDHDLIGEATAFLGEIVSSSGQRIVRTLTNNQNTGRKNGSIIISAEEVRGIHDVVWFQFTANKLPKKGYIFTNTAAFLVLSRSREDGSYVPVYKSEVCRGTVSPVWKPAELSLQRICNGDAERPLQLEVFHFHSNGNHELLGRAETSLNEMQKIASESQTIELSKSKGAPAGSAKGILTIPTCQVVKVPSCLEYIAGGCEISLIVAIDFTASNGPPSSPDSLHFNTMGGRNQYQRAILAVGEILANYDTDKLIPAYGFGAQLPPAWNVSHCFALTGNPLHPECAGVQGVMDAYLQTLNSVRLCGPTVFS